MRVLITCVGGAVMPDLLIRLKQDPVIRPYIIGVDASREAYGRHFTDKFYTVPPGGHDRYVERVSEIVALEKIDLVVPYSDQEAIQLSQHIETVKQAGAVLLTSSYRALELMRDKAATYRTLERSGLSVPCYALAHNLQELIHALADYGHPDKNVIVKPVNGRGGRGMRLLVGKREKAAEWIGLGARENRHETPPSLENMESWFPGTLMVMPLLNAPAYDADVLRLNAGAQCVIVRRRNNPAGIPFTGNHIVFNLDLSNYCLKIAAALELDSLHDMDFMTDNEGNPCLLEVNPRPSGSLVAAHAAGYPILAAAISEKLGQPYPLKAPKQGVEVSLIPRAVVLPS